MKTRVAVFLFVTLLLMGCGDRAKRKTDEEPKADLGSLLKGNRSFALDLYAHLRQEQGNLFFSPYSVSDALAMTYAGARGETAEQMAHSMHFILRGPELHAAFAELSRYLHGPGAKRQYQLNVANALWGQKGCDFLPDFLTLVDTKYDGTLKEIDFQAAPEEARQTINRWVEQKTDDQIKNLLKSGTLTASTRLVLTNAIYFKAPWLDPFPKRATTKESFQLTINKTIPVRLMNRTGQYAYFEEDMYQALVVPYAGKEVSMLVLLPKRVDGLAALEQSLSVAHLDHCLLKMRLKQVSVSLPKFKTTSAIELSKTLSTMGMSLAFSGAADFSGMTTHENLSISHVVHQAYVDVNEEGTEAAASTAVVTDNAPTTPPIVFRADHPFLFVIGDNRTGSILFMGRVANPGA